MQADLRRLAHGADEQQHADRPRAHRQVDAEEVDRLAGAARRAGKMVANSIEPNTQKISADAEREAEVADAVDDERLDRGGVGAGRSYQKPISR